MKWSDTPRGKNQWQAAGRRIHWLEDWSQNPFLHVGHNSGHQPSSARPVLNQYDFPWDSQQCHKWEGVASIQKCRPVMLQIVIPYKRALQQRITGSQMTVLFRMRNCDLECAPILNKDTEQLDYGPCSTVMCKDPRLRGGREKYSISHFMYIISHFNQTLKKSHILILHSRLDTGKLGN
jgi:hypothetical protein